MSVGAEIELIETYAALPSRWMVRRDCVGESEVPLMLSQDVGRRHANNERDPDAEAGPA